MKITKLLQLFASSTMYWNPTSGFIVVVAVVVQPCTEFSGNKIVAVRTAIICHYDKKTTGNHSKIMALLIMSVSRK